MKATLLRKATPMDSVVLVVSLIVALGLYAACLQVSSRMHRRTSISWAQALRLALLVGVMTVASHLICSAFGATPGLVLPLILGAGMHLIVGGWFFGTRGVASDGQPLGWRRSAAILTLALVLFAVLTLVVMGIVVAVLRLTFA